MTLSNKFRKLLNSKVWEQKAQIGSVVSGTGPIKASRLHDLYIYAPQSATSLQLYDTMNDAWYDMKSHSMASFTTGACVEHSAIGPSGTATSGTTTTLTTNLTLAIGLAGYKIRLTGGPGAGDERTILSNTVGANSVITVSSPFSTAVTSSTTYTLLTGSLYMFGGGTLASGSFRKYDAATYTYTSLSITGLPASFGSVGFLIGTPSIISNGVVTSLATGTATSATSTTLTNSAKTWTTNQWSNAYQVRITGGTGAGQTRAISSNTSTTLTVASAWTTTPDATSTYSIEGNDDYLYLLGNGSTTVYRYSISGNSWTTLSPSPTRTATLSGGGLAWLACGSSDSISNNESDIINGRRIYSIGLSNNLDYYDIALNAWTNGLTYGPANFSIVTSSKVCTVNGKAYLRGSATTTSSCQILELDPVKLIMRPYSTQPIICSSATVYNSMDAVKYVDGSDEVPFIYICVDNFGLSNPTLRLSAL